MSGELFTPPLPTLRWQGTWTNLYYNHSKSKHVCFSCDCIHSLNDLWCSPYHSAFVGPCFRVHSTNGRSELGIRQTSMAIVIDEDIGLAKGY